MYTTSQITVHMMQFWKPTAAALWIKHTIAGLLHFDVWSKPDFPMAKRQVGLFSGMSAPKPKRGRESEEGLSVSEEVTFVATNDPSVAELEDLRVEDENEVGTSETALDTIPDGCSSQCWVQPNDKYTEIIEYENWYLQSC